MRFATRYALILGLALVLLAPGCIDIFLESGGDFLATGKTESFFAAIQVDPRSEDSAGPQFVEVADINGDGLADLVSAWNQSQPIQIHLQRLSATGEVSFETITLAGNIPVVTVAALAIADFDGDGIMDVAALVKEAQLPGAGCLSGIAGDGGLSGVIVLYLGPDDPAQANQALAWEEVPIGVSLLAGGGDSDGRPETGGYTAMVTGDVDGDGDIDIVTAWNSDCDSDGDQVLLFTNLGPGATRDGTWRVDVVTDPLIDGTVKCVVMGDVDRDGDLDIIATRPGASSMNIRWFRNPAIDVPDEFHVSDSTWQVGTIGQLATVGDIIRLADLDGDGVMDVVARSSDGRLIQWFQGPADPTTFPVRSIPWRVFTIAEFTDRTPEAIALGDLDGDSRVELIVAAEGGLLWFGSTVDSVYDQWFEHLIIDDSRPSRNGAGGAVADPNVDPGDVAGGSIINSIIVSDVDADGENDIVVTLDRQGLSGLSNDVLVWFRNLGPAARARSD